MTTDDNDLPVRVHTQKLFDLLLICFSEDSFERCSNRSRGAQSRLVLICVALQEPCGKDLDDPSCRLHTHAPTSFCFRAESFCFDFADVECRSPYWENICKGEGVYCDNARRAVAIEDGRSVLKTKPKGVPISLSEGV